MTVPRMILSGIYYRPDNHFKTSNDLKINYLNLYTDLGSLNQGENQGINCFRKEHRKAITLLRSNVGQISSVFLKKSIW